MDLSMGANQKIKKLTIQKRRLSHQQKAA